MLYWSAPARMGFALLLLTGLWLMTAWSLAG